MSITQIPDVRIRSVLQAFRACLRGRYGDRLKGVVLFGSRARGDYRPESDVDVAVFLDSVMDPVAAQMDIAEDAYSLFLENGLLIQPWVFRGTPENPDISWGGRPVAGSHCRRDSGVSADRLMDKAERALEAAKRALDSDDTKPPRIALTMRYIMQRGRCLISRPVSVRRRIIS